MAYTNFQNCTANEYKNIIYNQETNNKIKVLFNNVELEDADEYCESFEVVSRVIPNGSKIFMLENLVSQEATLVLHNIDTSIIQDQVSISIGTLVSENTYEYVPIGIYNLQEIPTTDNGKTTIKLRDNSVKLDFNYNAKPLIDQHGGTATKLQILQDICSQANITCNVSSFIGSSDLIGIYDNTITGRQYVAYLAGSAGAIPIITRSGALDFKYLNNLSTIEIPIEIVEQYSNAENFKISRVVYEDAIRKYESGNETYDTLFLDSANPYISSQEQVASIYNIVNNFEINSFKTGRILGNPAIDSYDLIQITDYDGTIFKTFANNTLRYNGKMINTFASEISFERKKENVSLKSNATFKNWAKTEIDNANAQITIQAGRVDEIEQDIQNPTSTKENKYFDLEDALDSPLIDFSLYGETQQDSTTGKNLLIPFNFTRTNNGITYAYSSDGSIKINGTSTATSYAISTSQVPIFTTLNAGEYIISGATSNVPIRVDDENGSNITSTTRSRTFTINQTTNIYLQIRIGEGATINETIYPMIRLSSVTDDTYEPYTNGASPNPTYPQEIHNVSGDNTIEICGKNLFSSELEQGTLNSSGQETSSTTRLRSKDFISINSNTQYTLSFTTTIKQVIVYEYASNNSFIQVISSSWNSIPYTFTTSLTARYIKVVIRNNDNSTIIPSDITDIMLEKGSTSSEYEPYTGNSQLISLGVENLINSSLFTISGSYNVSSISNGEVVGTSITGYAGVRIALGQSIDLKTNDEIYVRLKLKNSSVSAVFNTIQLMTSSNSNIGATETKIQTPTLTTNYQEYIMKFVLNGNATLNKLFIQHKGNSSDTFTIKDIQISYQNGQYTPYGITPIELCKIGNYQDYFYKTDKWYLHKEIGKVVLDGSENITTTTYSGAYYHNIINLGLNGTNNDYAMSNYYTYSSSYKNNTCKTANGGKDLVTRDNFDNATYITWLGTNKPIFYYLLATPTDTEITDTTLIGQLNNLMTLPLYKNMTHITLTPNDLQPTMKIEYYRDTSINENFVPKEDMTKYYTKIETNAQIKITGDSISSEVARVEQKTDANNEYTSRVETSVTNLQTDTRTLLTFKQNVEQNGVETLKNTLIQADINGLSITKGENFKNLMTDRNQKIESNGKEIMFMGYDDAQQKNVARIDDIESKRATIGVHRCETMGTGANQRTAWFYVGGGN